MFTQPPNRSEGVDSPAHGVLRGRGAAARPSAADGGTVVRLRSRAELANASAQDARPDGPLAYAQRSAARAWPQWPAATLWCLLAWTVAVLRVHAAAARHEVFGLESGLAFVVAYALPFTCLPSLLRVTRSALRRLHSALPRRD